LANVLTNKTKQHGKNTQLNTTL